MAVSVSGPVYAAVANLKSEADGAVQLLQNQVAVAQKAADEYAAILAELVNTDAVAPAIPADQPSLIQPAYVPADAPNGLG